MGILLWVVAALLAAAFLAAGAVKLIHPKDKLIKSGMPALEEFNPGTIKLIGSLEVLGAAGLILPGALKIAPTLVPLAAVGVALLMGGAIVTHIRRHEAFVAPLALLVLAAVVAWGRFGPYSIAA